MANSTMGVRVPTRWPPAYSWPVPTPLSSAPPMRATPIRTPVAAPTTAPPAAPADSTPASGQATARDCELAKADPWAKARPPPRKSAHPHATSTAMGPGRRSTSGDRASSRLSTAVTARARATRR